MCSCPRRPVPTTSVEKEFRERLEKQTWPRRWVCGNQGTSPRGEQADIYSEWLWALARQAVPSHCVGETKRQVGECANCRAEQRALSRGAPAGGRAAGGRLVPGCGGLG